MTAENPLLLKAQQVARAAQEQGGRALLVGGFVRDQLLGLAPKDADLEVYGLEAPKLRELLQPLGRVDCVGESFRVYKLVWRFQKKRLELDVSLPRRDRKTGEGHRGFEVEGDPFASIEDAARRRDFTLNAILCDPLSGEILDPFGGRADLENRLLRAVDFRHFGEDSLRVLRAMQFAARFELQIEPQTAALCRNTPLNDLPKERVWGEWEKLLLKSSRPSLGIVAARETGVLSRLFPYLETALERRESELLATLDGAAREKANLEFPFDVALMLASLATFLGASDTKELLDDLNIHKMRGEGDAVDVRHLVLQLESVRKTPRDWFARRDLVEDKEFRFFAARISPPLTIKLARARGDFAAAQWFESSCKRLEVWDGPPAPILMGRHLLQIGFSPGPHIGKIVQNVYFRQLSGEIANLDEALTIARDMQHSIYPPMNADKRR